MMCATICRESEANYLLVFRLLCLAKRLKFILKVLSVLGAHEHLGLNRKFLQSTFFLITAV